jgi:acetyl/propionyl-CoA carboxylase alpha subunit
LRPPEGPGVRHDAGIAEGTVVSSHYDALLAKLAVWGSNRDQALARLQRALDEYLVTGSCTNLAFLRRLVRHPAVVRGAYDTRLIENELPSLIAPGAVSPDARRALAAAAAVAAAHRDERAAPPAEPGENALSPWTLAERAARFER